MLADCGILLRAGGDQKSDRVAIQAGISFFYLQPRATDVIAVGMRERWKEEKISKATIPKKKKLATIAGRVPGACLPCVRLVSAMCLPCVCLQTLYCTPFVRHVTALSPPRVRFGRASKPFSPCVRLLCLPRVCPPCVRSLPAQIQIVLASGLCPLVACCRARSWQYEVKYCATHHVYIACPLVRFLGIHFGSTNSAFASAPYAWKTVSGLCCIISGKGFTQVNRRRGGVEAAGQLFMLRCGRCSLPSSLAWISSKLGARFSKGRRLFARTKSTLLASKTIGGLADSSKYPRCSLCLGLSEAGLWFGCCLFFVVVVFKLLRWIESNLLPQRWVGALWWLWTHDFFCLAVFFVVCVIWFFGLQLHVLLGNSDCGSKRAEQTPKK